MFDQFLGLPLHPLVVHAVVVLLPLGSLGLIALAVWSKARPAGLPLTTGVLAAAAAPAWVARFSGQALERRVGTPEPHASLGAVLPFIATLALAVAALWWILGGRHRDAVWIRVLAVATALAAIAMTAVVGHSGAQAVWGDTVAASSPAPSEDPGGTPASSPDPTVNPSSSAATPETGTPATGATAEEVAGHSSADDCWVIVGGTVYDLTAWVNQHPGGASRIAALCGTDGTAAFEAQHSDDAEPQERLAEFALGPLIP